MIVTRREVERLFLEKGVAAAIHEAAREISEQEHARARATTAAILREVRKAETDTGSDEVMTATGDPATSILQSLIAAGEGGELELVPLENGGFEAIFDTRDWRGWAGAVWEKIKSPIKNEILRPASAEPAGLPNAARIALVGDWGTGLYGAPKIKESLEADADPFALLVHLGDIYYSGSEREVKEQFLDPWPKRPEAVHRALNGNHEMYSGGQAYFRRILPEFHQDASYFAHQNDHFTIVGLDVAYQDHAIDDLQVEWLEGLLRQAGERKILLLSHHHLFSTFESQGAKLWAHPRFAAILESRRIFAWYWAHEHRCVIYQEPEARSGLWGRCLGHGGMPQSRRKTRDLSQAPGQDLADWRLAPARIDSGRVVAPPGLVLEGPNPLIPKDGEKFTPHGYAVLTLDGPHLLEQVLAADGRVIYEKRLA